MLDQFAGSGAVGEAAIATNRKAILIELDPAKIVKIAKRLHMQKVFDMYTVPAIP